MTHQMRLTEDTFKKIAAGTKTVEARINDEKRRALALGDELIFINRADPGQTIRTIVRELLCFPTIAELGLAVGHETLGWKSQDDYIDQMRRFYSSEEEAKYGVVGIRIECLQ